MCGILGATNSNFNFDAALNSLHHRGPDSQVANKFRDFTLGFTRLAIIDLSSKANQPMSCPNNKVHIVFNGEIYGFKAIREFLETKGYKFKTLSDSEVLLNAYLHWDEKFLDHIDGMFAIAIYDERIKKVKLFRDRAGIKPLYYFYDGGKFAFSSELKGILALCENCNFQYDNTALYDYMTYSYIPDPKTLYKNVLKLRPAHQLTFNVESQQIESDKPFWSLNVDPSPAPIKLDQASQTLRSLIQESLNDQMIADVPIGFFLSGGIDSSVLVAEASRINDSLSTFTIGFENNQLDETKHAKIIANQFKTNHHSKILSEANNANLQKAMKIWYDEPFADTSAIPTYLVSQFAKENVTVALSGDGGDELFGGYQSYRRYQNISRLAKALLLSKTNTFQKFSKYKKFFTAKSIPYKFFSFLSHLVGDDLIRYSKVSGMMDQFEKKEIAQQLEIPHDYDDFWFIRQFDNKQLTQTTRVQLIDFHTYLPCNILTKVDRASMAVSLETRVPFLSKKIIEFAFSLPEKTRLLNGNLKGLIKEAYKDTLPQSILKKPKRGFSVPLNYLKLQKKQHHELMLKDVYQINLNQS